MGRKAPSPRSKGKDGYESSEVPVVSEEAAEAPTNSTNEFNCTSEANNLAEEATDLAQSPPQQPQPSVSRKGGFCCPLMSADEVAAITVSFGEVDGRLLQVLERYGAAIVTDVLSAQECDGLEAEFAADLHELLDMKGVQQADRQVQGLAARATTDVREFPLASLGLLGEMQRCQLRGLPHGRFAWAGRLHPNVRHAYEVIHGTNELVSSCDNSFFAPASHSEQTVNRSWPHVDHNKHDHSVYDDEGLSVSDWEVFQGLLYVWGSEASHASTTVVWCGSHQDVYEEMMADEKMQRRGLGREHFSRIADLESQEVSSKLLQRWQQEARRVPIPKGSLLLWSSRTVHQGWSGGPRLAQPVCWEPVGRRSERAHETKLRLAALGLPSTHWASLGIPHTLVNVQLAAATHAQRTKDGVALPLKSTLRPVALANGVDVLDMWKHFQKPDWKKPLPADLKALLMSSIEPEILNAL